MITLQNRHVIVFEDEHYDRFYPLSLSHPTFDLLAGTKTNLDRIRHHFHEVDIFTTCRPHLADPHHPITAEELTRMDEEVRRKVVLINGSTVFCMADREFVSELKRADGPVAYLKNDRLVAAILPPIKVRELLDPSGKTLDVFSPESTERIIALAGSSQQVDILTFSHIWEPVNENENLIQSDFEEYYQDRMGDIETGDTHSYGKDALFTGDAFSGDAGSVIDARNGPVIIGKGVDIKPLTFLEGPAFVGNGCKLVGGKVTGGSSFGPGCRIGGEVEATIIIGNTNKYHEGFIGHAYIGQWVNLGALTTNSDLANNYGDIKIRQNGSVVETGQMKIGSFIGDHTKIGIGMTLNTGSVIGFSSNLFGGSLILEKEIPSFGWGNDALRSTVRLKSAMETARIVMNRRGASFTEAQSRLFESVFEDTRESRSRWIKKSRPHRS